MKLGIFTKVFQRSNLEEVADAIAGFDLTCVQMNLESALGVDMPDQIDKEQASGIRRALEIRGIQMSAVSGTYNMIHPDPEESVVGMGRLQTLADASGEFGTSVITLCTGTRDPDYMWARHPDNDSQEAWNKLVVELHKATEVAEQTGVTLAFEPEVSNVIDSAVKARRILDEIGSPKLKVVIDGANLYHKGELAKMHEILDEAFDLLGNDIVLAHAKDVVKDGEAGHVAAGTGLLDYDYYIKLLEQVGFEGGLIMHSLEESQVQTSRDFLSQKLG